VIALVGAKVRRALALTRDEWALVLRAAWWLALADIRLRFAADRRSLLGLRDWSAAPANAIGPDSLLRARTYARWIEAMSRYHVVRARCLHQSLALHAWLKSDGIASRLYIGVRKVDGKMQAHAWVVAGDKILIDEPRLASTFTPLRGAQRTSSAWLKCGDVPRQIVRSRVAQ
jgi:hypothetical protein